MATTAAMRTATAGVLRTRGRAATPSMGAVRRMGGRPAPIYDGKTQAMNAGVGGACVCFVGGVYWYSSNKMKDDELSQIDTEINLHESGLKFTNKGELIGDATPNATMTIIEAQAEGAGASGGGAPVSTEGGAASPKKRRWYTLWLVKV
eukprot:CAMPEP_0119477450 /NCGR_PEP_ID=MMETSP1344-20130328/7578_1 /TAXON_ID=236787 /ORGANISM="Florenciella parvula, Strain CCMP2471" /LENGTH=148 /DNA_ID=CAMNT_0007511425 /DNA_START=47 /DNA_END=493 /DNA_ORIENTATION=-